MEDLSVRKRIKEVLDGHFNQSLFSDNTRLAISTEILESLKQNGCLNEKLVSSNHLKHQAISTVDKEIRDNQLNGNAPVTEKKPERIKKESKKESKTDTKPSEDVARKQDEKKLKKEVKKPFVDRSRKSKLDNLKSKKPPIKNVSVSKPKDVKLPKSRKK